MTISVLLILYLHPVRCSYVITMYRIYWKVFDSLILLSKLDLGNNFFFYTNNEFSYHCCSVVILWFLRTGLKFFISTFLNFNQLLFVPELFKPVLRLFFKSWTSLWSLLPTTLLVWVMVKIFKIHWGSFFRLVDFVAVNLSGTDV